MADIPEIVVKNIMPDGVSGSDGFGGGGIMGGLLLGSLLGTRGGLFGNGMNGGYGNGFGGTGWNGATGAAIATDITLTPAFTSLQSQISNLSNTVNTHQISDEIQHIDDQVTDGFSSLQNSISNIATAQAAANFTTLQSINGLGSTITAQSNQNALQQLNSFNNLTTTTLQGFNGQAMQVQNTTNQIISQGSALAAQLATCCCELKEKIASDGDTTRALITNNRFQDLEESLAQARLEASQSAQTNALIAALKSSNSHD